MQKKLMWKTLTVLILCLLSMIPLALVRGVISERQMLRNGVVSSLERETVGSQTIKGPVLIVPYTRRYTEKTREKRDGKTVEVRRERHTSGSLHVLPESVEIIAHAAPEERRRGIYRAQAYSGDWMVKGRFALPSHFGVGKGANQYTFHKAKLDFGISDPRGLASEVTLSWNNAPALLEAGTNAPGLGRGVHALVDAKVAASGRVQTVEFALQFGLTGLNQIRFLPLGRDSSVTLTSGWPAPGILWTTARTAPDWQ